MAAAAGGPPAAAAAADGPHADEDPRGGLSVPDPAELRRLFAVDPKQRWAAYPDLVSDRPKVVLMGDSVLDNFIWLKEPKQWLRPVLQEELERLAPQGGAGAAGGDEGRLQASQLCCVNLAVDQMTTFDILKRTRWENSWGHYQHGRERTFRDAGCNPADRGYEHLAAEDGCIYSAENLRGLRGVRWILLSVGGNDVYLRREIQEALVKSCIPFRHSLRTDVARDFGRRLRVIVDTIAEAAPGATIVPVIVYHPHNRFSISGLNSGCTGWLAQKLQRSQLRWLVTPMVREMLAIARERGLPVIDLSRTFDPDDVSHYGNMDEASAHWSGAEPSDISQRFIARLACEVCCTWRPGDGSVVFRGEPEGAELPSSAIRKSDNSDLRFAKDYVFAQGPSWG